MTTSKFKIGYIFWFLLMLTLTILLTLFLYKGVQRINVNGLWTTTWISTLFILLISTVLIILKDFKLIFIDKGKRKIKWFSLFAPFGRTIYIDEYIGVIKSYEHGSQGSYQTAYLVDKNRITRFKVNGLFYRNFDELFNAINLREIRKLKMTFGGYIKLLFTGRMRV